MATRTGMRITHDRMPMFREGVEHLLAQTVLVGIPERTTERQDDDAGDGAAEPTNATLGYWHEFGVPEVNLPARPHLVPGIRRAKDRIANQLVHAARAAIGGDLRSVDKRLAAAGMIAMTSVQTMLSEGVPPPLADLTLKKRAARWKHRKAEREELARRARGLPPSIELVKPLIDTGQYRQAITYVVTTVGRLRGRRSAAP